MTKIEEYRIRKDMSRVDMCRACNCYSSDYAKIEAGTGRAWPLIRGKIAHALGLSVGDLFDAAGWPLEAEPAETSGGR